MNNFEIQMDENSNHPSGIYKMFYFSKLDDSVSLYLMRKRCLYNSTLKMKTQHDVMYVT